MICLGHHEKFSLSIRGFSPSKTIKISHIDNTEWYTRNRRDRALALTHTKIPCGWVGLHGLWYFIFACKAMNMLERDADSKNLICAQHTTLCAFIFLLFLAFSSFFSRCSIIHKIACILAFYVSSYVCYSKLISIFFLSHSLCPLFSSDILINCRISKI